MGIAIWLVPPSHEANKLMTIMRTRGSERSRLPSSYPEFDPHITLASFPSLSAPSLPDICASIPTSSSPLSVSFRSIDVGTHFFRSVYIAVTPTSAISALHERIHTKLDIEPRTPSFPHLSLCYIDDQDAHDGEREMFFKELQRDGRIGSEGKKENVRLYHGEAGKEDWVSGFDATEVWVVDCDGHVEGWKILAKVALVQ
ncbi:hypothetical protein Hypma_011791 [Hypsizygus marmoreus]|uniref:Cyclic phosphodiesterase n=1 Tax=Hypsizygus marmoreus TaxID=39966 RepID=A0A369JIF5_HYPMA|nr:hypothetical protein Hypma_011791 [Hypsizygus marmoreus]